MLDSAEHSTQYYQLHSPLNFEEPPFPTHSLASPEVLADTLAAEVIREVHMPRADWVRLRDLPWGVPLAEWAERGVPLLQVRRGESRHPVVFVERGGRRYAIKETSPHAAEHEASVLRTLRRREIVALNPVGTLVVAGEPILAGAVAGQEVYESGDVGYLVTRLAERVLPQSLLYRYPFTLQNKRLLWNAVADLLLRLHDAGVFWGDPSLANILIEFRGRQIRAVLADAETAEVHRAASRDQGGLSEGMRRQDLETLAESLIWQAEDIREARGLPEEAALVGEDDIAYFESRYAGLRAERSHGRRGEAAVLPRLSGTLTTTLTSRLHAVEGRIQRLAALGYDLLSLRWQPATNAGALAGRRAARRLHAAAPERTLGAVPPGADETEITAGILRPSWYVWRMRDLLGEEIPRAYAWRLHYHLNLHKWLMSEAAGRDVGIEAAVADWRQHVHEPLQAFVRSYLPDVADTAQRYGAEAAILDRGWQLSQEEAQRPVPIEEAALDYALEDARASLGTSGIMPKTGPEAQPESDTLLSAPAGK